ncbi:hypothetical protein FF011L_18190 [Roseimaritima multifibrata]|uniref:Uncharacterized protein n=1 Tax=Roseimaritima multifibrata TaxID=1930274 RepID=A0A517MDV4_9BACT|nr:hypothetical protein [Roseimaritima multifibrata]QDS93064.1 hypothetical protein FF011L_18190 [Roseimaritima multifibrata]
MSDDFDERIEAAINRGQRRSQFHKEAERKEKLSAEELRRLHTEYRLALSERIEQAVSRLANHFPGFRYETLYGEQGWGAACWRDNLNVEEGRRNNLFSRIELMVRPLNEYFVLELKGKGTVANKEIFNRSHFEHLQDVELESFEHIIDAWVVEYAELYSAAE